ncbi:MAG: hypothetical protein HZB25_00370 [Candidatus Eisenbacteria bacterium]|nr:hypothetical protein [Candidatus Eisenbacteria bacterium]
MLSRKLVLLGILVTACFGLAVTGCGDSNSIVRPPVDEAPIPVPEGVTAAVDVVSGTVSLNWLPSSSASVVGYNVYQYFPSPLRENSYVKLNVAAIAGVSLVRDEFVNGGDFVVKAVSSSGKESAGSQFVHLEAYTGPPDELRER